MEINRFVESMIRSHKTFIGNIVQKHKGNGVQLLPPEEAIGLVAEKLIKWCKTHDPDVWPYTEDGQRKLLCTITSRIVVDVHRYTSRRPAAFPESNIFKGEFQDGGAIEKHLLEVAVDDPGYGVFEIMQSLQSTVDSGDTDKEWLEEILVRMHDRTIPEETKAEMRKRRGLYNRRRRVLRKLFEAG